MSELGNEAIGGTREAPAGDSVAPVLVEALDICKEYRLGRGSVEVLRGVSLRIGRGELVGLRGASGAGKSTLLHLLGGLDSPSRGTIRFAGEAVSGAPARWLASFRTRRVGLVFQSYNLLPDLDALENVCLPCKLARRDHQESVSRGKDLLCRVGLKDRMDHRPVELSGGEQQRVAIARALINGPDLVLADEPTGNLDSSTGHEIIELLEEMRRENGLTMIVATHDDQVAARAPRVVSMVDGRIEESPR